MKFPVLAKYRLLNLPLKVVLVTMLLLALFGLMFFSLVLYSEYSKKQCYKKVDSKIPYAESTQELLYNLTEEEKKKVGIKDLIPTRRYYEMRKCVAGVD